MCTFSTRSARRASLILIATIFALAVAVNGWLKTSVLSGRLCFSQFRQDQFVVNLLQKKREGVFIDVGASDGLTNSNSAQLQWYYGWRGVCVEPGSRKRLLRWIRPTCINVAAPMSSTERDVVFAHSKRTAEHSGVESTSNWANSNDPRERTDGEHVRTATLNGTLASWRKQLWPGTEQHLPMVPVFKNGTQLRREKPRVDFLSVDAEGHEYEVLQGFPFKQYSLGVLSVERNAAKDTVHKLIKTKSKLVHAGLLGADDVYVAPELAQRARELLRQTSNAELPLGATPLYSELEAIAKRMLPFLQRWRRL